MKKGHLLLLLNLLIISCNGPTKKEIDKEFYKDKGSLDMGRIPLIKPFEVVNNEKDNWILRADDDSVLFTIPGVKEIRVINQKILIHSFNTTVNYVPVKEGWFVITPKTLSSNGFVNHQNYLELLYHEGFHQEPKLYDINLIFNYFDKNDTITWNY